VPPAPRARAGGMSPERQDMTPATVRAVLLLLLAAQATAGSSCVCATAESHLATAAEIRYVPDAGGDCWQSPPASGT